MKRTMYCLGTVQFGMDYGIQGARRLSDEKINRIIEYALNHGIHTFDTASVYGEAENVIGHYLRHRSDSVWDVHLISKLDSAAFDYVPKKRWGEIAKEHARKSMDTLGIDQFDTYLLHNAAYIFDRDAVRALDEVREMGLTKKIGVSVYTPSEAMKALEYDEIKAVQVPYNVFDHRLDKCGFFDWIKDRDIDIYVRSTLLQGLLTMDIECLPPKMEFAKKYLQSFAEICARYSVTHLQAAIGYIKKHEGINYIVFGVDNLEQLKEYIFVDSENISDDMVDELSNEFENVEEKLVNPTLWK